METLQSSATIHPSPIAYPSSIHPHLWPRPVNPPVNSLLRHGYLGTNPGMPHATRRSCFTESCGCSKCAQPPRLTSLTLDRVLLALLSRGMLACSRAPKCLDFNPRPRSRRRFFSCLPRFMFSHPYESASARHKLAAFLDHRTTDPPTKDASFMQDWQREATRRFVHYLV